jgi:hypothetical protein
VSFENRLYACAAGVVTDEYLDPDYGTETKIYVSDDPANGKWASAAEPGFGDKSNLAVSALAPAFGRLYAATANADMGFQIWQTAATGAPPFEWLPVIIDGAGGFNHNLAVGAMAEFDGALYVGSGITGFGYDRIRDVGPASCELLRIFPNGDWDLLAGQMRFTPDGLKVPLSSLGPGLGDFYNSAICSLAVHKNVLYAGTLQWEAFRCLEIGSDEIVGGYQLWGSADGEKWIPVFDDGRGNPAAVSVQTLQSTPEALFVGTGSYAQLWSLLATGRTKANFPSGFEILRGQ